jgi:ribosomal protein S18 acetylase RimI-like enzyme
MTVRDARADELAALAHAVANQPLLQRYEIAGDRLAQLLGEAHGRGDPLIVVEEGGRARGFCWFLPSGTLGAGGYLRLIALEPGTEGRGLGGALLDELERRVALSSRHLFLLVSHWNSAAQRFYVRRGYLEVGRLPAFVRADTDELIFHKRLK